MHPNPIFRTTDDSHNLAFARSRGFGTLCINADPAPLLAHIPFFFAKDGQVELHLVRSNPIMRAVQGPMPAVISITGPDAYISPDWYGVEDQVPTWNYVCVHLRGTLERRRQEELTGMLKRLSAHFEAMLHPKPAWTLDKMSGEALEKMERMIVPFRFQVHELQSTWKLNQNKTTGARNNAAKAVLSSNVGQETRALSGLMTDPPAKKMDR